MSKRDPQLPTVRDCMQIAAKAEISAKTLDRFLKGKPVRPVVKTSIERAADELGIALKAVTQ